MLKRLLTAATLVAAAVAPLTPLAGATPAAAVTCTVTVRLSPGVNNAAVRCLEQRLVELNLRTGTADTVYDTTSVNAVKAFQRTRGLYPDGIVTSITGRQLGLRGALPAAGAAKVTVLGDSTSAAMRWYDEARNETAIYDIMGTGYDLQWSVESCRRLSAASCVGRTDPGTGGKWVPISVLPEMRGNLKGRLGDAVVIMAGYDDYPSITPSIDAIMNEAESQGVARVFWLTYRTTSGYKYGSYYLQHNAALQAARVRHPNLVVLDWNTYTHRQSAATQDAWFEADNIHMTRSGGVALAKYVKAAVDSSAVRSCTAALATRGSVAAPPAPAATPDSTPSSFHPLTTQRVFDSRPTKVGTGREVSIDLTVFGVPADATSAAVNVTAIDPCRRGQLTVYSCTSRVDIPSVSFEGGRTSAGMAIVPLTAGRFCVYASAPTDVVVELDGWFGAGGDVLHPVSPTRLVDTRGGSAHVTVPGPLAPNAQVTLPIFGTGPVPPSGATAVWLNVTAAAPGNGSGVFVYPGACGTAPSGSTASASTGRSASTAALVRVGADGNVCLKAGGGGAAHAMIDLWGWFDGNATNGLLFRALPVTWLAATTLTANTDKALDSPGVPLLVLSTASGTGTAAFHTCGVSFARPLLQEVAGERVSNVGAIAANAGGKVCVISTAAAGAVVARVGDFVAVT